MRGETHCDLNKQRRALEVAVTLLGCITESILGRPKEWLLYLLAFCSYTKTLTSTSENHINIVPYACYDMHR